MQVDDTAIKRRLMKELVNLRKTTEVSANMKDIKEIVGIPTGTNEAGGYLAASSIIYDINESFGQDAAIECLQVFTLCNSHDKPIEFYLGAFDIRENRTNASNTAVATCSRRRYLKGITTRPWRSQ
jgi:hypothetical protein